MHYISEEMDCLYKIIRKVVRIFIKKVTSISENLEKLQSLDIAVDNKNGSDSVEKSPKR